LNKHPAASEDTGHDRLEDGEDEEDDGFLILEHALVGRGPTSGVNLEMALAAKAWRGTSLGRYYPSTWTRCAIRLFRVPLEVVIEDWKGNTMTVWEGLDVDGKRVMFLPEDIEQGGLAKVKQTLTVRGRRWKDVDDDLRIWEGYSTWVK
jgi:hypothetical protein